MDSEILAEVLACRKHPERQIGRNTLPNVITDKGRFDDDQRTNPITTRTECMGAGMKTTKAAELQTRKIATRSKGSAASKGQILWQPT